jgi:hypothetical protein
VDVRESSVWREEKDPHPYACTDGLVFMTYTAFDQDVGDEVDKLEGIARAVDARKPTLGPLRATGGGKK